MQSSIEASEATQAPADSTGSLCGVTPAAISLGDVCLSEAIGETLAAPPACRAALFETLAVGIEAKVSESCPGHPWTFQTFNGTDGSRIFRGGVGTSLVIDPAGRLWRGRSYEDFETTYRIAGNTCEIDTVRPLYDQMREYLPR